MLQLKEISLDLGDFRLDKVSLNVEKGEYVVLLGPTGTGKTVLLETIAGLHTPRSGTIFLRNREVTRVPPEARHLGVVYQDYALFPHLTAYGNIAFGLKLMGKSREEVPGMVLKMANFLDIGHILNRRPGLLSGGERQRVALARALILNPHMLLLDEPLSALDRLTRDRLRRELKRIHTEIGVTILHITHDLSEAFFLADRLVVLRQGTVVQEGRPEEILKRPANRFVAELIGIQNFIPAKIGPDRSIVLEGLDISLPPSFPVQAARALEEISITLPDWAVDLFPAGDDAEYLATVHMAVAGLNRTEAQVEVHLKHERGTRLTTTLSLREILGLPSPLQLGKVITVGLLKEGAYWVEA